MRRRREELETEEIEWLDDDDEYYYEEDYVEEYREEPVRRGSRGRGNAKRGARPAKKKKRTGLLIAELVILALVLASLFGVRLLTKMQKVSGTEVEANVEDSISEKARENTETGSMKGYRNIALFGVDSTQGEIRKNTRSDSIMIASINQDTGECKLVSVYRDTYLNLGNDTYNKCNAAYAAGGPEQAIKMLNKNLDLNITDFITVGFGGLTDCVDALGGLDIDVDEAEYPHLNSYQLTMSQELGKTYQEITAPGLLHLNGVQSTAYCRIRYTAGDDFKRAARQREVLRKIFDKAKGQDPASVTKAASGVLSQVYTSLSADELLSILADLKNLTIAEENPDDKYGSGFPTEGAISTGYVGAQSCVIPVDLVKNVEWLHHYLFDDETYQVSETVRECAARISSDTGCYAE